MHLDGKAHGGTILIIRNNIKHYEIGKFRREFLQATSIIVEDWNDCITISVTVETYIRKEQYIIFFKTLGNRFIAAGDYNAKHTHWVSRLILPKGYELLQAIEPMNLIVLSTGEPYWLCDNEKTDSDQIYWTMILSRAFLKITAASSLVLNCSQIILL